MGLFGQKGGENSQPDSFREDIGKIDKQRAVLRSEHAMGKEGYAMPRSLSAYEENAILDRGKAILRSRQLQEGSDKVGAKIEGCDADRKNYYLLRIVQIIPGTDSTSDIEVEFVKKIPSGFIDINGEEAARFEVEPSDIIYDPRHNAIGGYGHAEKEHAVGLIIDVCRHYGKWTGVSFKRLTAEAEIFSEESRKLSEETDGKDGSVSGYYFDLGTISQGIRELAEAGMVKIEKNGKESVVVPLPGMLAPLLTEYGRPKYIKERR